MKKCSRCGTDLSNGQLVCPHCGKRQRLPRTVRCRNCGAPNKSTHTVCSTCGEPLRRDWTRPLGVGLAVLVAVAIIVVVAPPLWRGFKSFQPAAVVNTVQAVVSEVPVLVQVPTLTPSLTPSITPTPSRTPTQTPTPSQTPAPSLTPTQTSTPTPTHTPTPTPTPTRAWPTWTPKPRETATSTPAPTPTVPAAAAPKLLEPADGSPFNGEQASFRLSWLSSHTLEPDEYYEVRVRYLQDGAEVFIPYRVQQTHWWVDKSLYLKADQETGRTYHWSVLLVLRKVAEDGSVTFVPMSPVSDEWSFTWQ